MDANKNSLSVWQSYLATELKEATRPRVPHVLPSAREGDFDMDDAPELPLLESFPRLQAALQHLQMGLLPTWRAADSAAIKHQMRHRQLARVAIGAGTSAIVLAIVQMAVERQLPSLASLAQVLEVLAVIAGVVAVVIGYWAKQHSHWLAERHRAERLRILKFASLGWPALWQDLTKWKELVDKEVVLLAQCIDVDTVEAWVGTEHAENEAALSIECPDDVCDLTALQAYYGTKRLGFQEAYFAKRSKQHWAASHPWRHLSLPVFVSSTLCVLLHFLAGGIKDHTQAPAFWEAVEIWSLSLASIIPVVGLGIRVWLGAFEPHRSANLFAAKQRAIKEMEPHFSSQGDDPAALLRRVSGVELFFANEHREWLRLMLETEWML